MSDWRRDFQDLKDVLMAAMRERDARPEYDPGSGELEWIVYERGQMHDATNRLRARYQLPPVSAHAILRAEMSACGHIDYVQKFALNCADLVHESTVRDSEP